MWRTPSKGEGRWAFQGPSFQLYAGLVDLAASTASLDSLGAEGEDFHRDPSLLLASVANGLKWTNLLQAQICLFGCAGRRQRETILRQNLCVPNPTHPVESNTHSATLRACLFPTPVRSMVVCQVQMLYIDSPD